MPNRNVEGQYRYAYQGQEKDPETGMEAFELRLWDARIGRWLTTDPKNFHFSPYLGMANNPARATDPDGGSPCPPDCGGDVDGGSLGEVVVTGQGNGGGIGSSGVSFFDFNLTDVFINLFTFGGSPNQLQTKQRDFAIAQQVIARAREVADVALQNQIDVATTFFPVGPAGQGIKQSKKLINNPLTKKVIKQLDRAIDNLSVRKISTKYVKRVHSKMGHNVAQNAQVKSLIKKHGLDKVDQRKLHDYITGEGFSRSKIEEIIKSGEYLR